MAQSQEWKIHELQLNMPGYYDHAFEWRNGTYQDALSAMKNHTFLGTIRARRLRARLDSYFGLAYSQAPASQKGSVAWWYENGHSHNGLPAWDGVEVWKAKHLKRLNRVMGSAAVAAVLASTSFHGFVDAMFGNSIQGELINVAALFLGLCLIAALWVLYYVTLMPAHWGGDPYADLDGIIINE